MFSMTVEAILKLLLEGETLVKETGAHLIGHQLKIENGKTVLKDKDGYSCSNIEEVGYALRGIFYAPDEWRVKEKETTISRKGVRRALGSHKIEDFLVDEFSFSEDSIRRLERLLCEEFKV